MKSRRTPEEVNQMCVKAHGRIVAGERADLVCKDVGLGFSGAYYRWRRKLYGEKKRGKSMALVPAKPVHHVFPIAPERPERGNDYLTIKGSPEAVARFVREFGRGK